MFESKLGISQAGCFPAQHAAAVAIDSIPHYFGHKSANLLEATSPIEFGHPNRVLIPANFVVHSAISEEIWFSAARAESGIIIHPEDQVFKISERQDEV
jgi:hypothetical protein